ncbi:MAG: hypothetical protein JWP31_1821, partial [Aeromicrobium sp.]|nr:hypothetical protein [Aeromicrobium sp.]
MTNIEQPTVSPSPGRAFSELRETGLLWLINRQVFHPRGWAFSLHVDGAGDITGWSLIGDGVETWSFGPDVDED